MKKKFTLLLSMVLVFSLLAACGNNANQGSNGAGNKGGNTEGTTDGAKKDIKIAMVLPEEIGVNPFFELMDKGFKQAGEDFGVKINTMQSSDINMFEQNFRAAVAEGYDMIITATYQAEDALRIIAAENPDLPIAIIDHIVEDLPNVRSAGFIENQASFLLGAAAGLVTESNIVGNVVAVEGAQMDKYTVGFEKGLAHTNPDAKLLRSYVGSYVDSAKSKELALQQNAQGADFIAGIAAVGDFGIFEAAKEKGFYSSGQDVDRTVLDPKHIILSQLKEADAVTYDTVKLFVEDKFEFGTVSYGLADGGVGLTFVTTESESPRSEKLTDEVIAQLQEIAEGIKNGTIDTSITK